MNKPKVIIVDYGLGNLFNIQRAIHAAGGISVISDRPDDIYDAEKVILPGVGAFKDGIQGLKKRHLDQAIKEYTERGRPLFGICLGMQLLMSYSEEFGRHEGLDLINGKVVRFKESHEDMATYKIPHISWNVLLPSGCSEDLSNTQTPLLWKDSYLNQLDYNSYMYFLHSYVVYVDNPDDCIALTEYGRDKFCSVLLKNNIFGCQFHPERSGHQGLSIIKEFLFR